MKWYQVHISKTWYIWGIVALNCDKGANTLNFARYCSNFVINNLWGILAVVNIYIYISFVYFWHPTFIFILVICNCYRYYPVCIWNQYTCCSSCRHICSVCCSLLTYQHSSLSIYPDREYKFILVKYNIKSLHHRFSIKLFDCATGGERMFFLHENQLMQVWGILQVSSSGFYSSGRRLHYFTR